MLQLRALLFVILCLVTSTLAAMVPTLISCNNANLAQQIPGRISNRARSDINQAHAENILRNIDSQSGGAYQATMDGGTLRISCVNDPHGTFAAKKEMVSLLHLIKPTFTFLMKCFKRCLRYLNAGSSLKISTQSEQVMELYIY